MAKELSYWEKRRAQMMYEQMEIAENAANKIGIEYLKIAKAVHKQIVDSYNNTVNNFNIADGQIKGLVENNNISSYEELIALLKRNNAPTELIDYLSRPGQKHKYQKLIESINNINTAIDKLTQSQELLTTKALMEVSKDSYYRSIYEIQKHTSLGFSFNEWDEELFNKFAKSKWSGENYSKRIWNNRDKLAETVKNEILQGFIAGKTQNEMYDVIISHFATSNFNARRLIRTESCYAANEMEMQSYAECDIESYIFVATLDLKTSDVCASLDGQVFRVKDAMPGKNMPPMHPWCRSTTIEYTSPEALSKMKRRARDPITGKNIIVPADMKYEEWYDKYVANLDLSKILDTMDVNEQKKFCGGSQRWALVKAGVIKNPSELRTIKGKTLNQIKEDGIILLDNRRLKHSTKGDFTNLKNPKHPPGGKNGGNMDSGGHSQRNIKELEINGIKYNVEHTYPNGVRIGGVENHKETEKRLGNTGQSWFPKEWTDDDILIAGTYVANNPALCIEVNDTKGTINGKNLFQEYNGVTVGVFVDEQNNIKTVFPDEKQRKVSD